MFEVCRVEFLDHLDARAAVLCDLIDVCALHQAHADISVAQAVGGARLLVAVKFEFCPVENSVEQLDMVSRKNEISWLRVFRLLRCGRRRVIALPASQLSLSSALGLRRLRAIEQSLIRPDSARHTFAVTDTAFTANVNFQDFLAAALVGDDRHVAMLEVLCFVRA
jgi:hypothetical protein